MEHVKFKFGHWFRCFCLYIPASRQFHQLRKEQHENKRSLSASNNVTGKGIIRWKLKDTSNSSVTVEVKGYHMPHASVRLLSPQVLLQTIGGQSLQTTKGISLTLNNGVKLLATYCPQNNLPLLPLARPDDNNRCFWSHAFGFNANEFHKINSVRSSLLHNNITNLSQSQKEVLLWH